MLPRVLAREQVEARTQSLLTASGIRSYRQLTQRPLWDVAHAADLSVDETETLIKKLSLRLAPPCQSAFDLFLASMNHPMVLRTGLPVLDSALCGGLRCGAINELVGTAGLGKTQLAKTLAVRCTLEYPEASVLYFDMERHFSAKRVHQIIQKRVQGRTHQADLIDDAMKRIRVVRVENLADFMKQLKALDRNVPMWNVKLIVVDSIAALLLKARDLTFAQREHYLLRIARDLKYLGDVHRVFVVVTNRASTIENEFGAFTNPKLGETWAHVVTSRLVLERQPLFRAITVVKCPSAGPVIQPFTITASGVEAADEDLLRPAHQNDDEDFDIYDHVLENLDLTGLPTVPPSNTGRSTQQSENDRDEDPRLAESDDIVSDSNDESSGNEDDGMLSKLLGI